MKAKKCSLYINLKNGYILNKIECNSIAEAVRYARESCGFYYRVVVDGEIVRRGFCN